MLQVRWDFETLQIEMLIKLPSGQCPGNLATVLLTLASSLLPTEQPPSMCAGKQFAAVRGPVWQQTLLQSQKILHDILA